jgi:hypothetical protein
MVDKNSSLIKISNLFYNQSKPAPLYFSRHFFLLLLQRWIFGSKYLFLLVKKLTNSLHGQTSN